MAGIAALRAGAGLVTIACPESAVSSIAAHCPEIMIEPLPETPSGEISRSALDKIAELAEKRTLVAIGPGIGTNRETRDVVARLFAQAAQRWWWTLMRSTVWRNRRGANHRRCGF